MELRVYRRWISRSLPGTKIVLLTLAARKQQPQSSSTNPQGREAGRKRPEFDIGKHYAIIMFTSSKQFTERWPYEN
jgi:hypothetical protein